MATTFTYKFEEIPKNNVVSWLMRYGCVIHIYQISTEQWNDTRNITVAELLEMIKTNDYLYLRVVQTEVKNNAKNN